MAETSTFGSVVTLVMSHNGPERGDTYIGGQDCRMFEK